MLRRTTLIQGPAGPSATVQGSPTPWTPGTLTNGSFVALDVTVTGALVGNGAFAGWDSLLPDGVTLTAQVKSAGLVRCLMMNQSGTSQTITAGHVYAEALNP